MTNLLETIERFNRKERFILFEQALAGSGRIGLAPNFHEALQQQLPVEVPPQVPVIFTDYHLSWLFAALELASGNRELDQIGDAGPATKTDDVTRYALEPNQEDIDLLLGWEDAAITHLVLVEAKAHSTWTNKQLRSKAARLEAIFGADGQAFPGVQPHFLLTSYKAPAGIKTNEWPTWMTPRGSVAHVDLAAAGPRLLIGRTDADGKPNASGEHFTIRETPAG